MTLNRAMKRAGVAVGRLLPRPDLSSRRVVFCYHSVHPNRPFISSTPEIFERHLQWLAEHCRFASLVDLVHSSSVSDNGKPAVAITFDDGYADNHSHALPILLKVQRSSDLLHHCRFRGTGSRGASTIRTPVAARIG